jgi:serine/threonine protein kinase
VLIDFGAVRESMGLKLTPQGQSTQSIVIGTPGYMPSEQAAGRAIFSSDVYALGLTAIYALTGKIPQELPTDPMTGDIQWRQYAQTVSNGLAGILDRAIASHSRDRFATAAQMMESLRSGFVSGLGVPGTVVSSAIPTQVSGAYPVNPAPVYPAADSQIRTVVAAHPQTAYPAQTGYVNPVQAPLSSGQASGQASGQDPKTWLMAIGVGALVTLAGVGIYVMLRGKEGPATVASSPAPTVVSPAVLPVASTIASPTASVSPAAIAPPSAPVPTATPIASAPVSTPAPVEIRSNAPVQKLDAPQTYPVQTTQVSFDAGTTGSTIRSSGRAGETHRYTLNCGSGQRMTVYPSSGAVQVMIKTPGGGSLGSASAGTPWHGRLPATGDYAIEVTTTAESSYVMSVEVN